MTTDRHRRMGVPARAKHEALLALEVVALSAVAFSRPILDIFGQTAFPFIGFRATAGEVVWFGLIVTIIPAIVVILLGLASGAVGRRARTAVHVGSVAVLSGLAAWWMAFQHSPLERSEALLALAAVTVGGALAWLRWWPRTRGSTATFLRYASVAPVVFLLQFLLMSDGGSWAFDRTRVDEDAIRQTAADLGEDPPPVVIVVLDALPTATLLDGSGRIDAEVFPNFAELAGHATWYRNHTSVAMFTSDALPAIITGRYPDPDPAFRDDVENLFALLGGRYLMYAEEPVSALCPRDMCVEPSGRSGNALGGLLGSARDIWVETLRGERAGLDQFEMVEELGDDRLAHTRALIDEIGHGSDPQRPDQAGGSGNPPLYFFHLLLPHGPWLWTDDGTPYEPAADQPIGAFFLDWTDTGTSVALQRHVLQTQATDMLLGELFDRLREQGMYDESLIVVTADHGEAFLPNDSGRRLSAGNQHLLAWVPLIIKAPGQSQGDVNDDNVMTIDIVPTIADMLGTEVPWEVDGMPAGEVAGNRDPDVKLVVDNEFNVIRAEGGETRLPIDAEAGFERLLTETAVAVSGPDAPWRRTEHADLVRKPLDQLTIGDPADVILGSAVQLDMTAPPSVNGIATDDPLPIEVVATTELPPDAVVAYGLNGRVAALTEVEQADPNVAHALLLPELFIDGDNDLSAYLVEGQQGEATLHPVDVNL